MSEPLFPQLRIEEALDLDLRRANPWWEGKPLPQQPLSRRHLVEQIKRKLDLRLAPITVVRGPRQIGKTTAQMHVLSDLLSSGVPPRNVLRIQADELTALAKVKEPILRIVDWYEGVVLQASLNEAAARGERTYLFFDEVQNLRNWAPQLKYLVDHSTTQVVVTGSSALRIELGRDSLAGRISTIETGVLSLTEIATFRGLDLGPPFLPDNGLEPLTRPEFWRELHAHGRAVAASRDAAFAAFSERGGYPIVHQRAEVDWNRLADQLNENVIKRVIQHDLRVGDRGRRRDALLLEEVFRLACRYVGQCPSADLFAREAQRSLNANVGTQKAAKYPRFLGDTLLLQLIEPLEIRLKRRRSAPKICLVDHGLRASWLQEQIPLNPSSLVREPHLSVLAGHIAESVVGATLKTIGGLDVAHFPSKRHEPEVDFVLTIGTKRIPLEVKYQRKIDPYADTEGLRSFLERTVNNAAFGLLIVQTDDVAVPDPRIICLPLSSLMLMR